MEIMRGSRAHRLRNGGRRRGWACGIFGGMAVRVESEFSSPLSVLDFGGIWSGLEGGGNMMC